MESAFLKCSLLGCLLQGARPGPCRRRCHRLLRVQGATRGPLNPLQAPPSSPRPPAWFQKLLVGPSKQLLVLPLGAAGPGGHLEEAPTLKVGPTCSDTWEDGREDNVREGDGREEDEARLLVTRTAGQAARMLRGRR